MQFVDFCFSDCLTSQLHSIEIETNYLHAALVRCRDNENTYREQMKISMISPVVSPDNSMILMYF